MMEERVGFQFNILYMLGYLVIDVPDSIMDVLKEDTFDMIERNFEGCKPYNKSLAGHIKKEFLLDSQRSIEMVRALACGAAPLYWKCHNNEQFANAKHKLKSVNEEETDVWVNFQKKGEANPIHHHAGDLSYVIYVNLPYSFKDEDANLTNTSGVPGTFQFVYANPMMSSGIQVAPVYTDRTFEGKMILFSANLPHSVNPFHTSDEYRISIAGNIDVVRE